MPDFDDDYDETAADEPDDDSDDSESAIQVVNEPDMKRTTPPTQDEVVMAVVSRASNAQRLATQFVTEIGDPFEAGFDEIASGGIVLDKDLRTGYEIYDELWPLEGRVPASRMKALEEGAKLTAAEEALYTKRKLAAYFLEPIEGAGYVIAAVTSTSGRTAYWTEIREGDSMDGVDQEILGIFPSVTAAKAALRRKGLMSARHYRPRDHARGAKSGRTGKTGR